MLIGMNMLITDNNADKLIDSGVPEIYKNAITLDKIKGMDPHKSFYLSGGIGVGKTHYAWAYYIWRIKINSIGIEKDLFRQINNVWIVNVPLMMQDMQGMRFDERKSITEEMMDTPLLILDDIGTERQTDYTEMIIHSIVEHRYASKLYTGFTSNLKLNELYYDGRIISRIKGIVGNNFGVLTGKDRRVV